MKVIMAILLFSFMQNSYARTLNLCIEEMVNLPYIGKVHEGIFNEFMDSIETLSKFKIVLHHLPWKRCLRAVELGEMDGAYAVIYTKERDSLFSYPKQNNGELDVSSIIWQAEYSIFTHQDSDFEWDGASFNQSGLQLSAPRGYVAYQKLSDLGVLHATSSHDTAFELVAMQRLDGYIVERAVGESLLKKKGINDKIKQLQKPFLNSNLFLVLSNTYVQAHPNEAIAFWTFLAQVRTLHGKRLYQQYMQ